MASSCKHDGTRGTIEEDLQRWMHFDDFAWQVQYKRYESDMFGGQGADFLRMVAFESIRFSGLLS